MRAETLFVAGYSLGLLAVAIGLSHLGRAIGRSQAGQPRGRRERHRGDDTTVPDPGWPHSEVPRFYTGIALVAGGASTLLSGSALLTQHRPAETAVLVVAVVAAVLTIVWLQANRADAPRVPRRRSRRRRDGQTRRRARRVAPERGHRGARVRGVLRPDADGWELSAAGRRVGTIDTDESAIHPDPT